MESESSFSGPGFVARIQSYNKLRHAGHELEQCVQEKTLEFIAKYKDLETASRALNAGYMKSDGFYPIVHFKFRGRDVQCQLSHPPCPTAPHPIRDKKVRFIQQWCVFVGPIENVNLDECWVLLISHLTGTIGFDKLTILYFNIIIIITLSCTSFGTLGGRALFCPYVGILLSKKGAPFRGYVPTL